MQPDLIRKISIYMIIVGSISLLASPLWSDQPAKKGWLALPIFFYTPETGFAGGAGGLFYSNFTVGENTRSNQLGGAVIYTQNNQLTIGINYQQYFFQDQWILNVNSSYKKFPEKYWGIGPHTAMDQEEEYTPQEIELNTELRTRVANNFFLGPCLWFSHQQILCCEQQGQIDYSYLFEDDPIQLFSVGFVCLYDSRDNPFRPNQGAYLLLRPYLIRTELGSTYNFSLIEMDFRQFFSPLQNHVLAWQTHNYVTQGQVPFQYLPRLGGSQMMRGYYEGRFRDKIYASVQAEYRSPVWWKLGGVAFFSLGQVAPNLQQLSTDHLKYAGGMGIRFLFKPEDGVNLRMDIGWSPEDVNIYLNISEAF